MITRCFGVLGDPIAHSRSPAMQQAAFDALGLPHRYLPFRVTASALPAALAGIRALELGGVNLTVPHKQAALAYLDHVAPAAVRIGAVNTIEVRGERLIGHNTDGAGFVAGLAELGSAPVRRAIVLGTGGAARAVVDALLATFTGVEVRWVGRDAGRVPAWSGVVPGDYADLSTWTEPVDLWVNATTVGMRGGPGAFPVAVPLHVSTPDARVVDLGYPRPAHGLWGPAVAHGLRVQDGLPMLLWQGVGALRVWLAAEISDPVVAAMRAALQTPVA